MNNLTIIGLVAGGAVLGGGVVVACAVRSVRRRRNRTPLCGWRHCRAAGSVREVLAREERRQRPEEMRN
jgi:hypothetical protein